MEKNNPFETSFIPQQPTTRVDGARRPHMSLNVPLLLAMVLFFATLAAAGGVYFYRTSVEKRIDEKKILFASEESKINIDSLKELQHLDERLKLAEGLVVRHSAFSAYLAFLESQTLQSIGFASLTFGVKEGDPVVNLSGEAPGYMSVYVQEQALKKDPLVKNVSTVSISLNELTGVVRFDLNITLDPSVVNYAKLLENTPLPAPVTEATPTPEPVATSTPQPAQKPAQAPSLEPESVPDLSRSPL